MFCNAVQILSLALQLISLPFHASANQITALPTHFAQRFSPASPCQASPKHCNTSLLHSTSPCLIAIAIQYSAFPLHDSTVHFHSFSFAAFFGLPLLIATPLRTSDLFAALPLLGVSIQCLCIVIRFHAHAKLRFSIALHICSVTLHFCSLPLLFIAVPLLRFSMPSPSLTMLFCSAAHPYPTQPMLHAAQPVKNRTIQCLSTA